MKNIWVKTRAMSQPSVETNPAMVVEDTGQELPLQINSEETGVGVDVFVTRHLFLQNSVPYSDLDICFGSRHDALWIDFFYSFVISPRFARGYNRADKRESERFDAFV